MTLVSSIQHIKKFKEGGDNLKLQKKYNPGNSGTFHSANNQSKKSCTIYPVQYPAISHIQFE